MIHLDAAFLIDLQREWTRDKPGPAFEFMEELDEREILAVSVFAVAEVRLGAELARRSGKAHKEVDEVLSGRRIVSSSSYALPVTTSADSRRASSCTRRDTAACWNWMRSVFV